MPSLSQKCASSEDVLKATNLALSLSEKLIDLGPIINGDL